MDEFEKKLKADAGAIRADMSPELKARIDASLHGVEPIPVASEARPPGTSLWWASSLTGLAAAVVVIVLVNLNTPDPTPAEPVTDVTVPEMAELPVLSPLLDVRNADFTSPLEEELLNLQSDLEKARKSVREDLDFTF